MALKERRIYPVFKGFAKGGSLFFEDRRALDGYVRSLDGKQLDIILKEQHKHKSRKEEKFYHGVVVRMVADDMCISDQEAHDILRGLHLKVEEKKIIAGIKILRYERVLSTTELSDKAYQDYWKRCIAWAALPTLPEGLSQTSGLSLYIPYPNEVDFENW